MISLIVAMTKNRVIGKNNEIPWHISEDLIRTKKITMGHPIIMGQKTHESISNFKNLKGWEKNEKPQEVKIEHKLLPGRTNIILSKDPDYDVPGGIVVHSIEESIEKAKESEGSNEIFILGGSSVFNQTIDLADKLYVTVIEEEIDGDVFFPEIDESKWELSSSQKRIARIMDKEIIYSFNEYIRKS